MKKILRHSLGALVLALIFLLVSCSAKEEVSLSPITADEVSGEVIWKRVSQEAPYRNYSYWDGHEGIRPGQAPHGVYHRILTNNVLMNALPLKDSYAPDGTIIVKENLTAEKKLDSYTIMVKVTGYSPETNDWYWVKAAADGTIQAEGSPKGCISCHEGMAGNDYVITKLLNR